MEHYKRMTKSGSVNIPAAMRHDLGIEHRDGLVITEAGGEIRIRPYTKKCVFCGSTERVGDFHGRGICAACAKIIAEKMGGAADE